MKNTASTSASPTSHKVSKHITARSLCQLQAHMTLFIAAISYNIYFQCCSHFRPYLVTHHRIFSSASDTF